VEATMSDANPTLTQSDWDAIQAEYDRRFGQKGQAHADTIRKALDAYYRAVEAAEADGFVVNAEAYSQHAIGSRTPSYKPTVTVSATHQQSWRA
jgi:hypothetical protein